MFRLQLLGPEHEAAVLDFERDNRAYFVRSISDRGDAYFEQYAERHRELIAEQVAGTGAFYLLVDDHGSVVGRFNLYRLSGGTAEVGYRVAERVAGTGAATAALRSLCRIAARSSGCGPSRQLLATRTWRRGECWRRQGSSTSHRPRSVDGRAGPSPARSGNHSPGPRSSTAVRLVASDVTNRDLSAPRRIADTLLPLPEAWREWAGSAPGSRGRSASRRRSDRRPTRAAAA